MSCLCVHVLLYERCSGQGPEEIPLRPGQLRHAATLAHLLRSLLSSAWCGTRRLCCHRRHIPRTEQDVVVWWFLIKCWQFSVDNVQIIRLHNWQCPCSFTWLIILDNVAKYECTLNMDISRHIMCWYYPRRSEVSRTIHQSSVKSWKLKR